jgi:hypothetical protein
MVRHFGQNCSNLMPVIYDLAESTDVMYNSTGAVDVMQLPSGADPELSSCACNRMMGWVMAGAA